MPPNFLRIDAVEAVTVTYTVYALVKCRLHYAFLVILGYGEVHVVVFIAFSFCLLTTGLGAILTGL